MSKSARAAMSKSKSIDHQLEAEKEKKDREILLLVLGKVLNEWLSVLLEKKDSLVQIESICRRQIK